MEIPDEVTKGLFAIGGAVVGAVIKGWFDSQNREYKRLTLKHSKPVDLVVVAQQVASRIEVHVDGQKANLLATSELQVINTGNRAVLNPVVVFVLDGPARIIAIEKTILPQGMENDVTITSEEKKITVTIPHLNPLQEIGIRLLTDGKDFEVKPAFSQPDVALIVRKTFGSAYMNPISAAFFESVRRNGLLHFYFKHSFEPYRRYLEEIESIG